MFVFAMLKFIVWLAFVATFSSILTGATATSGASTTNSCTSNNEARCQNNEEYLSCPNKICKARTCDQLGFPLSCAKINNTSTDCGNPGCYCKDGFVKNKKGVCIPLRDCPSCGGDPNAWSGSGTYCTTCNNYKNDVRPCPLIFIFNSCDCRPNYVYNTDTGKCVLPEHCPKPNQCGDNEVYEICPSLCNPRTCKTKDRQYKCEAPLQPGDPKCPPPTCRCADNYYRNNQGKCVLKEQCPPNCGQNEVVSDCANSPCIKNCATKDQNYQCKPYPPGCKQGCVCADGYYRNGNGTCVRENECERSEICPKQNEYFDLCPASCPGRKCGIDDRLVLCVEQPKAGDANCPEPSCRCKEGFYRSPNGDCVTWEECPPSCGKNEVAFDCVNSPCLRNNCAQKDLKIVCRRKPSNCKAGCICADGYLRADNGTCVPKDQCPSTPITTICKGQFEEYSDCKNGGCDRRNCTELGRPEICKNLVDGACQSGCVCKKGYLRNAQGVCVPTHQCPKNEVCSKPHEYYDLCPATCPARQCGKDDSVVRCGTPLSPGDPKCPPPACRCENGYYRNVYGDCVTLEECSITCGQNEIYYPCPKPICANQTCENIGKIYDCPLTPVNYTCQGECRCQPGFYRNKIGQCITEEQCKKCTGDYEYFACSVACDNECEKLKYQSQKNCSIINVVCNPMCYCFEGYARDANKICIPISQCPPGCDNENEEYVNDPNKVCRPKTCDDLGFPLPCNQPHGHCTHIGKPGCICKAGLVRDKNGVCISEEGCQTNQSSTTPTAATTSVAVAEQKFYQGSIQFSADFFNNVVQDNIGRSVIVSPFSTLVLLSQVGLYAKRLTLEQLLNVLKFDSTDEIREAIPAILDSINNQRNVTLSLVDRVYGNKRSSFSDAFKKDTEVIYRAEAENIDMTNGQAAADYINKWVASKTNDKILDLIPGSLITPNTELVLVNAIYCLAEWRYKFDERNTQPGEFYVSKDKNVTVNMMNQVIYINYTENKEYDAKAIELPYVNSNLTCLILLPNNKDGAQDLVSKLARENSIKSIRESFTLERVSVSIPKFNSTTTTDLKEVLIKLNITELFNPNSNGLSGILADPSVNIFVTAGIQKANIIINESGSEASAANAIIAVATAFNPELPKEFLANYSFPYYILFRGIPIFSGLFTGI